jgi:hypothetical protein
MKVTSMENAETIEEIHTGEYSNSVSILNAIFYTPYKESQIAITGITREDINRKVALLNEY